MHYTEQLHWILDKVGKTRGQEEELYQRNIDFVHSLGLKCDCVGWCKVDMAHPRMAEILDAIEQFCRSDGWTARGYYTRELVDEEAEWFELKTGFFKEHAQGLSEEVPGIQGPLEVPTLRACNELVTGPKIAWTFVAVPDRVRRALAGEPGVDFCWLRDKGHYAAEQYFGILPEHRLDHLGISSHLKPQQRQHMEAIGGWAPRVGELFRDLQIDLPDCYLRRELPERGMAACRYTSYSVAMRCTVLVHRTLAQRLLTERALLPRDLQPALVVEEPPAYYKMLHAQVPNLPTPDHCRASLEAYEAFRKVPKPQRQVTEKQALTQLRRAKRDRAEDFRKPLPKAKAEALMETAWEPLIPYYRITDGGVLDGECEYELLTQRDWASENQEFQIALEKEGLESDPPLGVKFGRCADGDSLLLCQDGSAVRFSHEEPVVLAQWPSLHQFIYDTLTEVGE